ncbi:MAG: LysR substrate-binding domain-containing protein [Pseudomonadota bacterium]
MRVRGRIQADSSAALRNVVLAGLGIGLLPLWLVGVDLQESSLIRVLEAYEPTPLPISVVSPPRKFAPPKVKAFNEYIAAEFKRDPCVSRDGG